MAAGIANTPGHIKLVGGPATAGEKCSGRSSCEPGLMRSLNIGEGVSRVEPGALEIGLFQGLSGSVSEIQLPWYVGIDAA